MRVVEVGRAAASLLAPRVIGAFRVFTIFLAVGACSPASPAPLAPAPSSSNKPAPCPEGRADCDGETANGCEADLSSAATCGACGVACKGVEVCGEGGCRREHPLQAGYGACAIHLGKVQCWGAVSTEGDSYETPPDSTLPFTIPGIQGALSIRFNYTLSYPMCVTSRDGTAVCWPESPAWLAGRTDVRDVIAYANDTCAVTSTGALLCNGQRVRGVTGAASLATSDDSFFVLLEDGHVQQVALDRDGSVALTDLKGIEGASDFAAASHAFCALLGSGKVVCSESPYSKEPHFIEVPDRAMLEVPGLTDAVAIDVGCAVRASGEAVRWDVAGAAPSPIPGVKDARRIACGVDFGCYQRKDGAVLCWGSRRSGRLGDGAETTRYSAVEVEGLTDAIAVAAGAYGSCALRKDGSVWCWGTPESGRRRGIPAERIASIQGATSLASARQRTCAVDAKKAVHCFSSEISPPDIEVHDDLGDVVKAVLPDEVGAALRRTGEVVLFAKRRSDGASPPPVVLSGVKDAVDVHLENDLLCVLRKTGGVACAPIPRFSDALVAQTSRAAKVGDGAKRSRDPLPALEAVPGIKGATSISGDIYHSCAVLKSGALTCFGYPFKEGTKGAADSDATPFKGLSDFTTLFGGTFTLCAAARSGQLYCDSERGAMLEATGSREPQRADLPVKGVTGAVSGSASDTHACAVLATGKVMCWGSNDGDALGGGDPPVSLVPVPISFDKSRF